MQKVKYILIFTLLLALGMVYFQLDNHKSLTVSLIEENNQLDKTHKKLTNEVSYLKEQIIELTNKNQIQQDKIIALEEELIKEKTKIVDINFSIPTITDITTIEPLKEEENITDDIPVEPSVLMNEENEVDGFEIKYKQKF